jgi:glycosyltransferase involved in cell wall biosynthesis
MEKNKVQLSVAIITYNEIGYIEKCIESVSFADEIIVVDSLSEDGTFEYLKSHQQVKVFQNRFENFTKQKTFALTKTNNDWVLFLDADEVVTNSLRKEILKTLENNSDYVAYWFLRQFMFQDKKLRFSGWQTDKNYRLFRRDSTQFLENRIVHETLKVNGKSGVLKEKLLHYSYKNYEDYKGKMLRYGRLKAQEAFLLKKSSNYFLLKVKPLWKFLNHFILRFGFLDGKKGLIICYLNALGVQAFGQELRRLNRMQIT